METNSEHDAPRGYARQPGAIDRYVGSRIRLRRTLAGISQEQLAAVLGLTFQQVQKYENGVNRVGASRLFELSRALNVPIPYFFDDMPLEISNSPLSGTSEGNANGTGLKEARSMPVDDQLMTRETMNLVRAYYRITARTTRKRILELINSLATPEADAVI